MLAVLHGTFETLLSELALRVRQAAKERAVEQLRRINLAALHLIALSATCTLATLYCVLVQAALGIVWVGLVIFTAGV